MKEKNPKKKEDRTLFSPVFFWMFLGILLAVGGVHSGLFFLIIWMKIPAVCEILIILFYWLAVACLLTFLSQKSIRKTYDEPMQRLAEAAGKVAGGDFSVYVPTVHSKDKYDYLDRMILDFNKMIEELGSMETLKTDFFANVSHEMKTPLAVISNNAQLLSKPGIAEEKKRECTENILMASRRLNNLITNMLKLNKLEKQTIRPRPERYDVCEQLAECVFQYEEILEEKQLELEPELEDRCFVQADRELMELVWTNLISNAVKFTPDGGTIRLIQRTTGDYTEIAVEDTGCGMDEQTQKHIFDKFYQGDTSHATAGNGLGLALVKRILELSDGSISVSSRPGQGSAFAVSLPLTKGEDGDGE